MVSFVGQKYNFFFFVRPKKKLLRPSVAMNEIDGMDTFPLMPRKKKSQMTKKNTNKIIFYKNPQNIEMSPK